MSKRTKPWGSTWWGWSTWGGREGTKRLKSVVARTSKNRDIAPKRRKVLNRRTKGK